MRRRPVVILGVDPPVVGQVRCSFGEDPARVELSGEIDMACDDQFDLAHRALAARRPTDVVVDLAGVVFFGAAGLRFLAELIQALTPTGHTVQVVNPSRSAARLLDITGFAVHR